MSNLSFRLMAATFAALDFINPYVERRSQTFGIQPGMTLVDYGCGPGRYTVCFARLVGPSGLVYAVDVQPLAIETVKKKSSKQGLDNIRPVLAHGYNSGLPEHIADRVFALDMFFLVADPSAFLGELRRITRLDGLLVLDDGHQSRQTTKRKLLASGCWTILEESRDHLVLCQTAI
jgi:ubiquinone/menaquinone biosynthesis C-methylase UbiE